jgi:hypothetical protein
VVGTHEAREALQAIVRVCTQLELDRPQQDAQSVLLAAVRTIDEYLTGRTSCRNHDEDAAKEASCGWVWEVYLSDDGYTRMIIDPVREGRKVWLTYGSTQAHPGFAEKLERFKAIE